MKLFILAACVAVVLGDTLLDTQSVWSNFKLKHGKKYSNAVEETSRWQIFAKNYLDVVAHNKKYEQGLVSYKLGINKFADMTKEELKARNGHKKTLLRGAYDDIPRYEAPEDFTAPDEIDWRTLGAVTPIKDQGNCGSCWSFSSAGALEGALFRKTGKLVSISEQNFVDCSDEEYGNYGCNGGDMPGALQYVVDNDGVNSEETYPYEARTRKCRYEKSENVTSVKQVVIVEPEDEELLKIAVADMGPIAVALDASNLDFNYYEEGVYFRDDCLTDPYELDHAVLLIGYGTSEDGTDYWLIKNSWGPDWGEDGTIRVARKKNDCGISQEPIIPLMW